MHLNGCSYQLAAMGCAGALERVFLPFGWQGYGAVRVHLNGRSYHLAALERPWAGVSDFYRRSSKTGRERAAPGGKASEKGRGDT